MRFFESPPETITIDGITYKIDTDFRTWIEFQNIVTKNNTDDEKAADLLGFMEKLGLPFSKEALDAIVEFFRGGDTSRPKTSEKKQTYSFESDGSLIFSAFLTQYDVDLINVNMHWWKFKSMFSGLNDTHMISKVMWARGANISDLSDSMKDYAKSIRESYPLDVDNSVNKMTLEERNQRWLDYVARRFEEAYKG